MLPTRRLLSSAPTVRAPLVAAVILVVAAVVAVALLVLPDRSDRQPTDGAAATETAEAALVVATPRIDATPPPLPTATPTVPAVACDGACLIRLADDEAARAQLDGAGLRPVFAGGGMMWVGASPEESAALIGAGLDVQVVMERAETLRLYVVRPPAGTADAEGTELARSLGEVLDAAGGHYLVEAAKIPAPVAALTGAGVWVEKVPPLPAAAARDPAALLPLGDPGDLLPEVSQSEIEATILDLQGMSSTDGTGIGTRYYDSTGNVMAAEYLANRFAAYGLDVRYEDFVAANGTLAVNVVAELPGRETGAVYLFTAHYDTIADDTGDQSTAPGALDNGTGLAVMLEIARVLSAYDLAYPVRFVALNAEEVGLQGAEAFAAKAREDGTPYDAAFNVDAVGTAYGIRRLIINADGPSSWIQDLIAQTHAAYGFALDLDLRQNPNIVADETPLQRAGIPTVLVASMLYGDPLINQSGDTIDGVDLPYVTDVAALLLLCAAQLVSPAT